MLRPWSSRLGLVSYEEIIQLSHSATRVMGSGLMM
jgi:hypothetical protein